MKWYNVRTQTRHIYLLPWTISWQENTIMHTLSQIYHGGKKRKYVNNVFMCPFGHPDIID